MRLIDEDLSETEDIDGSIKFVMEGYVYYIGQTSGPPGWFNRQSIEDYENGRDKWEAPTGWGPENIAYFKLLKKY
jgi:hypothetical protein